MNTKKAWGCRKMMTYAKPVLEKYETFPGDLKLSRNELTLGYIKKEMPYANVIFDVETLEQLKENLSYWKKELPLSFIPEIKRLFNNIDEKILNPALWPN